MKKLIPALALLLVSAVLLATSSFAWFSMNTTVTVTGMSVTTRVDSNLLIADGAKANANDSYFVAPALDQSVVGKLEPVSSVNGVNFFYHATSGVSGSGAATDTTFYPYGEDDTLDGGWTAALADATAAKKGDKYDAAFNTNYGNSIDDAEDAAFYGYVDYVFYLKATNSDLSHTQVVKLTECDLRYNNGAVSDKAWRVAVFSETVAEGAAGSAPAAGNLKTIIGLAGADYFTDGQAISDDDPFARASVSNFGTEAVMGAAIASGATQRYKVTVRLWLEGEDESCNNDTYASLSNAYTLNLQFKLDQAASITGVTEIATLGAVATADAAEATAALNATAEKYSKVAASYQWYKADGTEIVGATSATYENDLGEAASVYCVVTTTASDTYRTNTVALTTP